jgi:WD40 repeat protein
VRRIINARRVQRWGMSLVACGAFVLQPPAEPRRAAATPMRRLASVEADAFGWSADGVRLAYARDATVVVANVRPAFGERCRVRAAGARGPIHTIAWSPDGRQLAFAGPRTGDSAIDGWHTIWLAAADCSSARDLVPPAPPFVSPGVRTIALGGWLNAREIAFAMHTGPGNQRHDKVDVVTGAYASFCSTEGGLHWSPDKTRGIADLASGALALIEAGAAAPLTETLDTCPATVAGCEVVNGQTRGVAHEHEAWAPDGRTAIVTSRPCLWTPATADPRNALTLWDVALNRLMPFAAHASRAAWSPDRGRIAVVLFGTPRGDAAGALAGGDLADGRPVSLTLVIVDAATRRIGTVMSLGPVASAFRGAPPALAERQPDDYRPAWSPDGSRLLIRDTARSLLLVRTDGSGEPVRLGDVQGEWAPDSGLIALHDGRRLTLVEP